MCIRDSINKPLIKRPRPEFSNRMSTASHSDVMPMMDKDELGDYHIYTLNDKHDLEAKENITVRMYGPLDVGYSKNMFLKTANAVKKKNR